MARRVGLRITQFLTLAILSEVPNAAIMELADRLDIEQTAMGKMTTTLERDGLVKIQRSPTDRRSRLVALTAEGRALLEKAVPLWREAQRQFETLNGTERVGALRPAFVFPEAAERQTA
jgi:DNA-binding MarR family transcriptional regulator